ncbi:B-cell receptor CD22 isoform X1 [Thunnus albacares]|uniref:B-cell receptor CD22 isoform X1 n=2 Tax=Thunnus albacares TaxID=8236 RepID=UPI001CF6BDAA|nr:B-cell receptor CD22 isoform X1 [Thunnus albacares]
MNAQTVGWLIFLALIKKLSCGKGIPFELQSKVEAKEGSCVEIRCNIKNKVSDVDGAKWFWMKNATWSNNDYRGTIIYSNDTSQHPVSPDFENRVRYIGSPPSEWKSPYSSKPLCSILICDLKKIDSGNYSLRYVGSDKWFTKEEAILTVDENPCLVVFETPPVVKENEKITLRCNTSSACPSNPKIEGLLSVQLSEAPQNNGEHKSTTVHFTANWKDDGKEVLCQTQDNTDKYMVRNISLIIEYAPKDTSDERSSINVTEGQSLSLTCSIKGRPEPTYTWFQNNSIQLVNKSHTMMITSAKDSQSGEYHCEAKNKHGETKSNPVLINVVYAPDVKIEMTSPKSTIRQGDKIILTCNVKRSKPPPNSYAWFKDDRQIDILGKTYNVQRIEPENSGTYTCVANNTVGTGKSQPFQIKVEYGPRKTNISVPHHTGVKVGHSLTFTCDTDANPVPHKYSWYGYNKNKQIYASQWTSQTTTDNSLHLESVQRADELCYICNATNNINTGEDSRLLCIPVLYPPTNTTLSMDTEVREGQPITIKCTVESFPPSMLTLKRTSTSSAQSSEWALTKTKTWALSHTFNVTSTHAGSYTCHAENSEGTQTSTERKLVVKYAPQDVAIRAQPNLVVNENKSLTLVCNAQSYPPVTSTTWMIDGKEAIVNTAQSFTLKSVTPSNSGLYSCKASNEIGSRQSKPVEVQVKYAPKHTNITKVVEQQLTNGTRVVMLTCSSHCYPPVKQYVWYMKMDGNSKDKTVSSGQNYSVSSNQPGVYYCIAENEIGGKMSDPYELFLDGVLKKVLIFSFGCLLIIIIIIIAFIYRCRRNKSIQQGTSNRLPWWTCFSFLACWNSNRRRNLTSEPGLAEPSRSRDDLLPYQPRRPKTQPPQPRPDTTAASNINSVYCAVNLPRKQGPSAQKPNRNGHADDDILNYASLQFGNKQIQSKMEQDTYAMVSKPKPPQKNEQETMEPYENIQQMQRTAHAAKAPDPLNYDSDTSEDEVELNYSQVTFTPKLGHQRDSTDSSTSDEEYETQYSEVKL